MSAPADEGDAAGHHAEPGACFKGHPELATAILTGIMNRGFDPAFCMDMPKPDRGIASGIIRTAEELTDWHMPIVPIMMNVYFCPQPTAVRCYQLGKAVREVIDEYPDDLRVGVVGLRRTLAHARAAGRLAERGVRPQDAGVSRGGDARGMAEYFESYVVPAGDRSQDIKTVRRNVTGMPRRRQWSAVRQPRDLHLDQRRRGVRGPPDDDRGLHSGLRLARWERLRLLRAALSDQPCRSCMHRRWRPQTWRTSFLGTVETDGQQLDHRATSHAREGRGLRPAPTGTEIIRRAERRPPRINANRASPFA